MAFFYAWYIVDDCVLVFSVRIILFYGFYRERFMVKFKFLLFLLASVFSFSLMADEQPSESKLELVTTGYEDVVIQRRFDATVEAVNKSTIAAQVSERIVEINFDVDDYVEQGVVLLRFNDAKQKARLEQAQANLREMMVASKDAEIEFSRIKEIYAKKLVAKATLDKAKAAYKAALERKKQAESRIAEVKENIDETIVRAPYSGIVTQRHVELGETPSVGAALMTGLSLNHLRVVADVPQQLISLLRQGCCPARIILPDAKHQSISSKKLTIFPIADSQTHSFKIRVELEEGQHGLYPGMFVKLELDTETQKRLMIPARALVQRGEVTGVYIVNDSAISFRYVKIGRRHSDGRVEIHAGIEPGEQVAIDPVAAGILLKGSTGK